MNPTLRDQMKQWKLLHQDPAPKKKSPPKKPQKRKSEHLSESDIKSLMNSNMRTLHRGKGGAWK